MDLRKVGRGRFRLVSLAATLTGVFGVAGQAAAFQIDTPEDWKVHWDNTISYGLGVRAQGINNGIGNNPVFSESDYKFSHAGDVVTNRLADLSEFDAVYQGKYGMRVSASLWKDFAYNNEDVNNNPGNAGLGSYSSGKYSGFTRQFYKQGGQLLDAFVFTNFDLNGQPSSFRAGRLTQYWGNTQFFGGQGISYGQNASDNIKALASPGTQAKELAIPRAQLLFQSQLTPTVSLAAQYFGEFQSNRNTTGGTFLGAAGFLYDGPDRLLGAVPRGEDLKPKDGFHSDYGVKLGWAPEGLRGNFGFYYRQLSEVQPWAPLIGVDAAGAPNYHLAYAKNVKLLGVSLDKTIGDYSTGFEVSYRQNTALNSATGPLPKDLAGKEGARGDTLHVIANAQVGLTPTALYDTGFATAELAYTRKLKVTSNQALYNGVGNASGCPTGSKWDGCSTDNSLSIAAYIAPQWLQVYPGVDLDMPMFAQYGLYGNTPTVSGGTNQGNLIYTIGLHTLIQQKYNLTLQYNGFHGHNNGGLATGPAGTYNASGNGINFFNDRNWVSLTFSTAF